MKRRSHFVSRGTMAAGLAAVALLAPATARAADVILQYFEGSWETMERRMPDVFVSGYDSIWVPPPGKADSGGYSVGYDVFDRFNLGNPYDKTLYGTEQSFMRLSHEMDLVGIGLYVDTVVNHAGFRDSSSPGFAAAGDYPGLVTTLPGDVDGDFHGAFEGGALNERLAGLNDIAQEKNHVFTRHPIPGSPNPIPNETPNIANRKLYPDQDLPLAYGRHPFNTADLTQGDPVQENATGLLLRYLQWLVEVCGVDGYRIDAQKHVPTFFFNNFWDPTVYNLGRDPLTNNPYTPFAFGENLDGDFGLLGSYIRKDGYGNRDVLDFPLFFSMQTVFNGGGFGDMRQLEFSSVDGIDGNFNDGTRGVQFATTHDTYGGGFFNGFGNLPHALVLTRAGYPCVYYNAHEFGTNRDFPKDGRGDAIGNYGDTITRLVRINDVYARGSQFTRWIDADVYVYERLNSMVVGINDRGDAGYDSRTVFTGFAPGTVLTELTGNATNISVDPLNDIFDTVTVDGSGNIAIRVPRNSSSSGFHGKGYVMYGPAAPNAAMTIANASSTIGPDPNDGRPESTRRLTTLDVVTSNTINVSIASTGPQDDNALVRLDRGGKDIDGDTNINTVGEFAGFESFTSSSPTFPSGTGNYSASIDATDLADGYHYIETVTFLKRPSGTPPVFDVDRRVVYLDRVAPTASMTFPTNTGSGDIKSKSYEVVVSTDRTVNNVHVLMDVPLATPDATILTMLNAGNKGRKHDRLEWRYVQDNIADGTHRFTVVAFEETGRYSITHYNTVNAQLSLPEVTIGIDTNTSSGAVNFQPVPGTINTAELAEEIVVRVNTNTFASLGQNLSFGNGDFTLSLQVDGGTPIVAQAYNAGLLPPVGRLVQNDQQFGDDYDEFRFVWRGYAHGNHTIKATAQLNPGIAVRPASESTATTNVPSTVPGPTVTITTPLPPGQTVNNPAAINVAGTFGSSDPASAQVFIDLGGTPLLLADLGDPAAGAFNASRSVGSYNTSDVLAPNAIQTSNGTYSVRVVASTGPNGTGIVTEAASSLTITGQGEPLPLQPPLNIDGVATDTLQLPLLVNAGTTTTVVSAADGGFGGANPADFGGDGTLTELHGAIRDNTVYLALRGDMFGASEATVTNLSMLFIDVNAGSSNGVTDLQSQLTDTSDGLRADISGVGFNTSVSGIGFDAVFGMTAPTIAYGYSFGSDGLPGTTSLFEYQSGFVGSYDASTGGVASASGTTIAGPNTFEVRLPLSALGNPDPAKLRFVALTASDGGFPSPNTLPENSSNAFTATQTIEAVAAFPARAAVRINEVYSGATDWIELFNPTGSSVSLTDWALRLNDSGNLPRDYRFPNGTTIPAGGYLIVSDQGGSTPPSPVAGTVFTGFNIPWDETRGGSVALIDDYGVGRDYVDWRDKDNTLGSDPTRTVPGGTAFAGTNSGAAAGSANHSLARDLTGTDTDTAADWDPTSGANSPHPTPGTANINAGVNDWSVHE